MSPEPDPGSPASRHSLVSFSCLFLKLVANSIVERMRIGDISAFPMLRSSGFILLAYSLFLFSPIPMGQLMSAVGIVLMLCCVIDLDDGVLARPAMGFASLALVDGRVWVMFKPTAATIKRMF